MIVLRSYVQIRMDNTFGGHLGHHFVSKELPKGDNWHLVAFSGLIAYSIHAL